MTNTVNINIELLDFNQLPENFKSDIDFMGFYESIHSDAIDSHIEQDIDSEHNEIEYSALKDHYDNVNWQETRKNYAKCLFDDVFSPALNEAINNLTVSKKTYDFEKSITFDSLWSPREYNFASDKIVINFNKRLMSFVWSKIDKADFNTYLLEFLQSHSGFASFFDDGMKNPKWQVKPSNWNHYQDSIVIAYLLKDFDRDDEFHADICIDSCIVYNDNKGA